MSTKLADLARTLNLTFGPLPRQPRWPGRDRNIDPPRAFVMTDTVRLADPEALLEALPSDVAMIFRHYDHPRRHALALRLVSQARRRGVRVLIAGDAELALRTDAHGVHLPGYLLGRMTAARLTSRRANWLVTAAVHNRRELANAQAQGLDAVLVSPVFATSTHVGQRPLGLAGIRDFVRASSLPVFALGGVEGTNLRRLRSVKLAGCAGIDLFTVKPNGAVG